MDGWMEPAADPGEEFYLASDVAALQAALREAMGWNWLDTANPPPKEIVDQCNKALMER